MEVGGGGEHFLRCGEDAVVGGGQLGQRVGRLVRGGGVTKALGEVGDGEAQRQVTGRLGVSVEVRGAVDVVSGCPEAGDGVGGETGLVVFGEAGGGAVVGLVEADDGYETRALEDAVCLGVPAACEEFVGVRVAADVQESVGTGRGDVSSTTIGGRCAGRRAVRRRPEAGPDARRRCPGPAGWHGGGGRSAPGGAPCRCRPRRAGG